MENKLQYNSYYYKTIMKWDMEVLQQSPWYQQILPKNQGIKPLHSWRKQKKNS